MKKGLERRKRERDEEGAGEVEERKMGGLSGREDNYYGKRRIFKKLSYLCVVMTNNRFYAGSYFYFYYLERR